MFEFVNVLYIYISDVYKSDWTLKYRPLYICWDETIIVQSYCTKCFACNKGGFFFYFACTFVVLYASGVFKNIYASSHNTGTKQGQTMQIRWDSVKFTGVI